MLPVDGPAESTLTTGPLKNVKGTYIKWYEQPSAVPRTFFFCFLEGGGGGGRDIPRIVSIWRPSENPYNISSSSRPCQALQKFLYDKKETFLSLNLKFQAVHWVLSFFFFFDKFQTKKSK